MRLSRASLRLALRPLLLAGCALASAAQRDLPPSPSLGLPRAPFAVSGRERGLAEVDGELWAVGASYKARFESGGVLIVPPLGVDAPRSLPLRLSFESLAIGGRPLCTAFAQAAARRGEFELVYERGAGVSEHYEVRSAALEHSFELRELPAERGELVVRMRIETELAPRAEGAGLFFEGAPGRGLRFGELSAIDARGRRVRGELRVGPRTLEYAVPADFMATAEAPLVLDPTIGGAFGLSPATGDFQDPDLTVGVESGLLDAYAAVYERHWSSTDIDIYGQEFNGIGALIGATILFEPGISTVGQHPAVARTFSGVSSASGIVAVWQQGSSVSGTQSIVARGFLPPAGLTASLTISSGSGSHTNPDAVGMKTVLSSGSTAAVQLVVWENDGIRGQQLKVVGSALQLVGSQYVLSSGLLDTHPSIAVAFEFADSALVVWERFFATPAPGDHDLIAALLSAKSNVPTVFAKSILTSIGPDETRPRAAGFDTSAFEHPGWVSYARGASSTSQDRDIFAMALTQDATHALAPSSPITVKASSGNDDHDAACTLLEVFDVSTVGSSRLLNVAWVHEGGGAFGNVVNGAQLNESCAAGCAGPWTQWKLCETEYPVAGAPTGLVFANIELSEDMAVFESLGLGIYAQEIGHAKIEGSGVSLGGGCFGGGSVWLECASAPNSNMAHVLQEGAPLQSAFLILGLETINASCGSCTLVPDPITGFVIPAFTDASGSAKVSMPIGSQTSLVGLEFFDQWASVPGPNPCAGLGVTLSGAAKYTIHL